MSSPFDTVKQRVTPAALVDALDLPVNRAGFTLCPSHNDHNASLKIYDAAFHCFVCGANLTVIDFIMESHNCSSITAVRYLNDKFSLGIDFENSKPSDDEIKLSQQRKTQRNTKKQRYSWALDSLIEYKKLLQHYNECSKHDRYFSRYDEHYAKHSGLVNYLLDLITTDKSETVINKHEPFIKYCHKFLVRRGYPIPEPDDTVVLDTYEIRELYL